MAKKSSSRYNSQFNSSHNSSSMANSLNQSELSFLRRNKIGDGSTYVNSSRPLNNLIKSIYKNAASNIKKKYSSSEKIQTKSKQRKQALDNSNRRLLKNSSNNTLIKSINGRTNVKSLQRAQKKVKKRRKQKSIGPFVSRKASLPVNFDKKNLKDNIKKLLAFKENQALSGMVKNNQKVKKEKSRSRNLVKSRSPRMTNKKLVPRLLGGHTFDSQLKLESALLSARNKSNPKHPLPQQLRPQTARNRNYLQFY